jgi:predicted GIY-YIG superfamily endonuclease
MTAAVAVQRCAGCGVPKPVDVWCASEACQPRVAAARAQLADITKNQVGVIYLLHFDQPYKHAKHYLGWTRDLEQRLADHRAGSGARLMAVLAREGIGFTLARLWQPADRRRERQIKNQGGLSRSCPTCGVRPRSVA